MNDDFDTQDVNSIFDFKGFLYRLLSSWYLFVITIAIAFAIAHYINVRKLPVYASNNLISIKDDQNPFFTSNTSLTFNWGGTTDKVNTAVVSLKSRSHNEKVVDRLQYYLNYSQDGQYTRVNAYKKTPFFVEVSTEKWQALGKEYKIVFKDSLTYDISTSFVGGNVTLQQYSTKEKKRTFVPDQSFLKELKFGERIEASFLNMLLVPNPEIDVVPGKAYYISFSEFDTSVKRIKVNISPDSKGSSVLKMSMIGLNKALLVDYLNTSVAVLSDDMLERKNLFATKTIRFIDSSLSAKAIELKDVELELSTFKNRNEIFDIESKGLEASTKLNLLDVRKDGMVRQINYFDILDSYLRNRTDYRDVPAPSVAGINEASIAEGVSKIIVLAQDRNKLQYSYKDGAPVFANIDRQIDAVKRVLLENINSSKGGLNQEIKQLNVDINQLETEIRKLPKNQQDLLKIERRYNLSQGIYDIFLAKRSEAGLVKAANVSDVQIIDIAKDTGGGKIGPNTRLNYMMALFFGFLIPFLYVFLRSFFSNKITSVKDIERVSKIPVLGAVGKSSLDNNLAVLTKPKSAIAESFRAIRSSLQFMYRKQGIEGTKTVLVTSSISGEGKTFTSINIASVFALSGKKTVLLGLDLRKPKIFDDFEIKNNVGVVNYLINDASIDEVIQKTHVPHLDIITSGPIPPNPSELLMGERLEKLIEALKETYDYIILDSPPLGLVADSLELIKFADATIYMVRQNYTKKGMFALINQKYKKGEVKNISFVLNFFEDKAKYGYGYGFGYGYGNYGNGYYEQEKKRSFLERMLSFFKKNKQ